jgi:hypothetical protein
MVSSSSKSLPLAKPRGISPARWKKLLIALIRLTKTYGEENVDHALLDIMCNPTMRNPRWAKKAAK